MSNKYQLGYPEQDRVGLSDEDVVSSSSGFGSIANTNMLKLNALIDAILSWARGSSKYESAEYRWFREEGFRCEILSVKGGGWIKGRLRFRLEFIPDEPKDPATPPEPQSPLSDLRSNLEI